MRILIVGGIIFSFVAILLVSNFSINDNFQEINKRSIDMTDSPSTQSLVLRQTEIGDQYLNPVKKSIPDSNWEQSEMMLQGVVSSDNIEQNVSFEFYSEMPTPSQKVLDRFEAKSENPAPRKVPLMPSSTSEINHSLENAINIDEFLDVEKKS